MTQLPERKENLLLLAAAPAIWAAHLLLAYGTAAVWCAKYAGADGSLSGVRTAIGVYTAVALAGIAFVGWRGFQRHRFGDAKLPHDDDTPEDRHRFLGFATMLLSGLSAVAVLYAAVPAIFIGTCR